MERSFSLESIVKRRAGHVLVTYGNEFYMWGGYMEEHYDGGLAHMMTQYSNSHFHRPDEIWVYSPLLNIWWRKICTGDIPLKLSGACAGVIDNYMYMFGGFNGDDWNETSKNLLWRLNLKTFVWKLVVPSGFQPFACDKSACWVYHDRFYIFGGYGPHISLRPFAPMPVTFEVESDITSKGWIDQLVFYDSSNDCWVWPKVQGITPCARAAHAASVVRHTAFIFGGRHKENRLNDFHCLDLEKHWWSTVQLKATSSIPLGRSWHTLTTVSVDKLFLYGGFSSNCQVLNDAWIYNTVSMTWEPLPSSNYSKRLWHCGALTASSEVIFLGGISNNILDSTLPKKHAEEIQRFRLSPPPLFELAVEYVASCKHISKKFWALLPRHIRKILEVRTDPFEIHGLPVT